MKAAVSKVAAHRCDFLCLLPDITPARGTLKFAYLIPRLPIIGLTFGLASPHFPPAPLENPFPRLILESKNAH